jgi:hypothetical protein
MSIHDPAVVDKGATLSDPRPIPALRPGARVGTPFPDDGPGACGQCAVRCERVVYPSGCQESGCERLYVYERDGRQVMGCLDRVFWAEIDVERFRDLQRTRAGFGGLRVWREPNAVCHCAIERIFDHRPHGPCVNPAFVQAAPAVPR